MADYPYEGQLIADAVTFQRAPNAAITVYDANDTSNTTPLALKDTSGLPLANPLTSSADAFTRPFYAPSQDIKLVGGGLTVFVSSAKGMRDAAAASAAAAEESRQEAAAAGANAAAVASAALADAVADAEAAQAAATAAAGLVGAPADAAIAAAVNGNGATKAALTSAILDQVETEASDPAGVLLRKVKDVAGGQFPAPVRSRSLSVLHKHPDARDVLRHLWFEAPSTFYSLDAANNLRKSTNGSFWTAVFKDGRVLPGYRDCFIKLANGNLVAVFAPLVARTNVAVTAGIVYPLQLRRSTDDGATWTIVHTFENGDIEPLGSRSICQDANTGYLYFLEYSINPASTTIGVYRSTDNGATWARWYEFPGPASGSGNKIRHGHSIEYDPISQRVYIEMGDNDPAAGIYRVSADGSTVEPVILNSQISGDTQGARTIGIMFFPTHLAWGTDFPEGAAYFYRMNRNQLGQANPVVERVYRANGAVWWVQRAADDSSVWLVTATHGSGALDKGMHVYAIEDNGATITEVGTMGSYSDSTALAPIGHGGDLFCLSSRRGAPDFSIVARLTKGNGATIVDQAKVQPRTAWRETRSIPRTTIAAGTDLIIGHSRAPRGMNWLYIYDGGLLRDDVSTGSARLQVVNKSAPTVIIGSMEISASGQLAGDTDYGGGYWKRIEVGELADVLFRVVEVGGTQAWVGDAYIVFGWGTPHSKVLSWDYGV